MVNQKSDYFDDLIIQCIEDELQIRLLEEQEEKYNVLSTNELEEIVHKKDENFKRIVFIKTHKTGSSTIQNIFYRYATGTLIFFLYLSVQFYYKTIVELILIKRYQIKVTGKILALPDNERKWTLGHDFDRKRLQFYHAGYCKIHLWFFLKIKGN